jgi:hypothetical protein
MAGVQTIDYVPFSDDGLPLDLAPQGGTVDRLQLWFDPGMTGAAAVDVGPATRVTVAVGAGFAYRFLVAEDIIGRFYGRVTLTPSDDEGETTFDDNLVTAIDLPTTAPGRISPYSLAIRAGIAVPTPAQLALWIDLIDEAYDEVETFLNRPARLTVLTESLNAAPGGWQFRHDPVWKILSAVARDDGLYDVTYLCGLQDPIALKAIGTYVKASALEKARWTPGSGMRPYVNTVSVEGQSVTFGGTAGPGGAHPTMGAAAGAPPTLRTLSKWKRRGVYSRPRFSGYAPSGSSWEGTGPNAGDARYDITGWGGGTSGIVYGGGL